MEKYLVEEFQKELTQIKEYIKHIQQVNNLNGIDIPNEPVFQEFKTHFVSFERDKKTFEYKAIVISLYGLLEKYIELWIKEYLRNLSTLVAYDNLSESIRDKHFELSMKLISIIMEGRYAKYSKLRKEDIFKKLNNCIENSKSYELNLDAFTMQTGNLMHNRIEEMFKAIDIIISKDLIRNTELVTLIGLSLDKIQNTESKVLFGEINELVDRRNTIAHGGKIDDLLELSALEPYTEFLEKYCIAIFSVLEEKNIENSTIEKYQKVSCKGVFSKRTVIGLSIENHTIKIGDWIIIETAHEGNKHFYKKKVISLGKDGKNDYEELKIEEQTNIAVAIENQESLLITVKCTFYIEKR